MGSSFTKSGGESAPLPTDDRNIIDDLVESSVKSGVKAGVDKTRRAITTSDMNALVHLLAALLGEEAVENLFIKGIIILVFESAFALFALAEIFSNGWVIDHLAIHSREPRSLLGVIFAPFLHGSLVSLLIDVVPFAVLAMLLMLRREGIRIFALLTTVVVFFGGLVVFFLGRPDVPHTGCGGLIFAYFAYLLLYGAFSQDFRATVMSIVVFILYGGMVWSLLPTASTQSASVLYNNHASISWESHCAGLIIGAVAGIKLGQFDREKRIESDNSNPEEKKKLLSEA